MKNQNNKVSKDTTIEELVELYPEAVTYLMEQGIRCIRCGEPIWGTLEEAAREKGFNANDIQRFVDELNVIVNK
jgi:hybrid cluster-associated redox disulfide protein